MQFKVYNENGIIRVTKITQSGLEQTMYSDIQNGQVAVINIEAEISCYSHKEDIRKIITIGFEENNNLI